MNNGISQDTQIRAVYAALEPSLIQITEIITSLRSAILLKDDTLLALVKKLDSAIKKLNEVYYFKDDGITKSPPFKKLIDKWGAHDALPSQVTEDDMKKIEAALGTKLKLPKSYKKNVVTFGLPTTVPELSLRIKDLEKNDTGIQRFLLPNEIIEISKRIRAHAHKSKHTDEHLVAIAISETGNYLCYEYLIPAKKEPGDLPDPPHSGDITLVCNKDTFECKRFFPYCESFNEWIQGCSEIKKLNATKDSYQQLKSYIEYIIQILCNIKENDQYKNNPRYTGLFSIISTHIESLNSIYNKGSIAHLA